MSINKSDLYNRYEQDTKELERIEKKLKELEKLSPEEQNKLYFEQPISEEIWRKKYKAITDESIVDTWKRIARFLSQIEEKKDIWYLYYFDLLEGFKFLPGGRIIYASDPNKSKVTSLNCFIGGIIEDSIKGIMKELTNSVLISKAGGGYGVNFSTLRPKGAKIKTTGGKSSGVLSFMHLWDEAARQIKNGGNRRSALLSLLNIDHPEIEDYIHAKKKVGFDVPLGFFNMSVGIIDGFMDAVKNDEDWDLKFNGKVYKTVKAKDLFDKIVKKAIMGEPGLIFLDNANKLYNLYYLPDQKIHACNGCSEILLPPYGSCLLGSFNLTKFISGEPFTNDAIFNFNMLFHYSPIALRMLDNVIDLSEYPLEEQREMETAYRHVGLGFTGLGDALVMLGKRYGNDNAIKWADNFMKQYTNSLYKASTHLALERGVFKDFDPIKFLNGAFVSKLDEETRDHIQKYGIRNATLIAVAPTGTISILANNVSSGIEPIFANSYIRRQRIDDGFKEQEVMDYAYKLWTDINGNKELPWYWVTAYDLTPDEHLDMLIAIQKWNEKSTSKTINLPKDYSVDELKKLYFKAWENGIKGITVFKPNDESQTVLEIKKENNSRNPKTSASKPKRRPFVLSGKTYKLKTPKEKYGYYITINDFIDEDGKRRPFEIFINTKDSKQPIFNFISRLLSALFRREKNIDFIIKEMQSTIVNNEGFFDPNDGKFVHSLIAYIGKTIKKHVENYDKNKNNHQTEENKKESLGIMSFSINEVSSSNEKDEESEDTKNNEEMSPYGVPWNMVEVCPECGVQAVVNNNGCKTCMNCGYSKCD